MVPISAWEKVLPMDIFPNELYRAILAEDIEEMEKMLNEYLQFTSSTSSEKTELFEK